MTSKAKTKAKTKAKAVIGAYVRVSTTDKQDTASQRHAIREWAKANHIPLGEIKWYEDRMSGKTIDRPKLAKLMRDVERGKVDTLVVFRLDRLARNTRDGLQILADVSDKGIKVVSTSEGIEWSNSTGRLIASILLSVATFERETTVERIKAGLAARRAEGHKLGRPRDMERLNQIRSWYDSGVTVKEICERLSTSRQNVYAALAKTKVA